MTNIHSTFYLIQEGNTPKIIAKFDNLRDAEIVAFSLNGDFPEYNFWVISEAEVLEAAHLELDENYIEA